MASVTRTIADLLRSLRRRGGVSESAPIGEAKFELRLGDLKVGALQCADKHWSFQYFDDFKKSKELRPLVQFPDLDKTYKSDHLWPFFLLRIPSLSQYAVQDIVALEKIDPKDEVALLRRFGKHAIANPFELVEIDESTGEANKLTSGILSATRRVAM